MKFSNILFMGLLLITGLISGCTWFASKKDSLIISPLPKVNNQFQPTILWKRPFGSKIGSFYFHSNLHPAYQDRCIFVADRSGTVKALNIYSGQEIWSTNLSTTSPISLLSRKTPAQLSGGISATGAHVYVGSDLAKLYAINVHSGSIAWEASVAGEALSMPVVSNGLVLIHTSNGIFQALNEIDGVVKWTIKLSMPELTMRGESAPATLLNTAILGDDNGLVSAVMIDNGQLIWQQRISVSSGIRALDRIHDIQATPVIFDGIVYVLAYNGNLAALDFSSGHLVWSKEIGSITNLLVDSMKIYLIDQNDHLMALNRHDGVIIWSQNKLANRHLTSPVLYSGYIVTGDREGYLHWINTNDGSFVVQQKIDKNGLQSSPIIAENKLIVQAKNGNIYAIVHN